MDERLKQQLDFTLEIDKEKNIFRQTHLSGHGRRENDAEHAWHMAIMAYLLREYANEPVDIAKVMLMCLIHDIVEKKPAKMPQRNGSFLFCRTTRKRISPHSLMSLNTAKLQSPDTLTPWIISSRSS